MNKSYINSVLLEQNFSEKRLSHIEGVVKTSRSLAEKYGADIEKAEIAALFHDMYKGFDVSESDKLVRELSLDEKYLGNRNLAHSQIAASMMERKFHIDDTELIDAVKYHTTGQSNMSLLSKIIFIADAIEPSRDYPGVEELRKLAFEDIDKACYLSLKRTVDFIKSKGEHLDYDTVIAMEYFDNLIRRRSTNMEIKEKALLAANTLSNKKARDVEIIDIAEKSSFADFFVLGTGNSDRQVAALADDVQDAFAEKELFPKNIEGKNGTGWILLDFGDVIVNVFTEEMRGKYSLEKVWGDCGIIELED